MKKLFVIILAVSFLIALPLSGCTQIQPDNNQETFSWIEYDDIGLFVTTDLARAQDEIPFNILVPTYIPGGKSARGRWPPGRRLSSRAIANGEPVGWHVHPPPGMKDSDRRK